MENLYIKTDQVFTSPKQFLEYLFDHTNYITEFTYFDKECTEVQCTAKRRSFEELYILFKTYFKNISKKELLTLLFTYASFYFCNQINKLVFHRVEYTSLLDPYCQNLNFLQKINDEIKDYTENTYTALDLLKILEEE
jgi:hypothetical protein